MSDLLIVSKQDFYNLENRIINKIESMSDNKNSSIKIYTSKELEDLLKITSNTLKKFRQEGLSFVRVGRGEYRYEEEDLKEFLSKHKCNYLANLINH